MDLGAELGATSPGAILTRRCSATPSQREPDLQVERETADQRESRGVARASNKHPQAGLKFTLVHAYRGELFTLPAANGVLYVSCLVCMSCLNRLKLLMIVSIKLNIVNIGLNS